MIRTRLLAIATAVVITFCLTSLIAISQLAGAEFRCGAIALSFNDNKHFGAKGFSTCEEAERVALKACVENSKGDCRATTCRNSCCALAMGPKGKGSGIGSTQNTANANAIRSCGQFGAGCKVVRGHCNFGDGKKID